MKLAALLEVRAPTAGSLLADCIVPNFGYFDTFASARWSAKSIEDVISALTAT